MNNKPARWSDFDRYLKGEHLLGKTFTLTIARLDCEQFFDKKEKKNVIKPVLFFRETSKGLIVSPTNADKLTQLFGDEISNAIGKRVTLKAEKKNVAGRVCEPIYIQTDAENAQTENNIEKEEEF